MKLSIITINYNNIEGLQKTIDSVVCQTWTDFEWIVIDGGSTDGSKELIEQYQQHFSYWCSEPDKGVYNAMNKGIDKAKGEYLLFLNSGDALYDKDVLQKVDDLKLDADIITGQVERMDNQQPLRVYDESILMQLYRDTLNHQGTFIKRKLFDNLRYDENYKIVSDWKFWLQTIICGNAIVEVINVFVAKQDVTGISSDFRYLHLDEKERKEVIESFFSISCYDISIIIPIFNVENYIVETLNSVAQQNTECHIECILIDDCGNDSSLSVAEDFIKNCKENVDFRIISHKKNKGLSVARNTGILNAKGKYLLFLDGDDKLLPECLQTLWDIVQNHPNVDLVKSDFEIEGVSKTILNKDFPSYTEDVNWIRTHFCNLSVPESACNCLVSRKMIIDKMLFFKEGWIQEDTLWTFKIQRHVKSIAFCHKPTYFYRKNQCSIMHTMDKEKEANTYSRIYNEAYHDMLSTKIELCELRYLEIMADRVYKAVGEKGLETLCTYKNTAFNLLFLCNRMLQKENILLLHGFLIKFRIVIRHLLCYSRVFYYH